MADKLVIRKDFWSTKILEKLNGKISEWECGKIPVKLQYNSGWSPYIIVDSGPILIIDLSNDEEIIKDIKRELNVLYNTSTLGNFYCAIHIFLRGAYIPCHSDEKYIFSTTTYLNQEEWDWNWGGALIYQNKDEGISAEFPEYNKMIIFKTGDCSVEDNITHTTSILSIGSPPRFSLQVFGGSKLESSKWTKAH